MKDEIAWLDEPYGCDKQQKRALLTSRLKYLTNISLPSDIMRLIFPELYCMHGEKFRNWADI